MICNIGETSHDRLHELIKQYGQETGLRRFLAEQTNKVAIKSFDELAADKTVGNFKFFYEYYQDSADTRFNQMKDSFGEKNVKLLPHEDRGRKGFKIVVISPVTSSDDAISTMSPKESTVEKTQYDKLLDRMQATKNNYYKTLSNREGAIGKVKVAAREKDISDTQKEKYKQLERTLRKEKEDIQSKLEALTTDIENIKAAKDLEPVIAIANEQLNWVESMMKREKLSESEVNAMVATVDIWENARDIIYGDEGNLSPKILTMLGEVKNRIIANDIHVELNKIQAEIIRAQYTTYKSLEELMDASYGMKDVSRMTGEWLTLADTGISVISKLDKHLKETVIKGEQEHKEWGKKLDTAFDPLEKLGKDKEFTDLLFQKNTEGNETGYKTSQYHDNWYKTMKTLADDWNFAHHKWREAVAENGGKELSSTHPAVKAKNKAFAKKINWLKENTLEVDIRFINDPTFENESGVTAQMHLQYLEEQLGKEGAQKAIEQAKEDYARYLEDKFNHQEYLTDLVETEGLAQDVADERMKEWERLNNPEVWHSQKESGKYTQMRSVNRYSRFIPKKTDKKGNRTQWYDKNYERIMSDPDMANAYNTIEEFLNTMLKYVPYHLKKDYQMHSGFLPRVHKDLTRAYTLGDAYGAAVHLADDFVNRMFADAKLYEEPIDPNTGKPIIGPKLRFVTPIEQDNRSKDLKKILMMFGETAIDYKYKNEVMPKVQLVNAFIEKIVTSRERKEMGGDQLTNIRSMIDYSVGAIIADITKAEEGKMGVKKFDKENVLVIKNDKLKDEILDDYAKEKRIKGKSNNDILNTLKEKYGEDVEIKSKKDRHKEIENEVADLEEQRIKGEITDKQFAELVKPLENEMERLGKSLYLSRVGDEAMKLVQAQAFWFNPFSAFNNYMFGITSTMMWGASGKDFTNKEVRRSWGMMWKSLLNIKDSKNDKIMNLVLKKFRVIDISKDYKTEQGNVSLQKLQNLPYILLTKGDYFIKGQTLVSMLLHNKIKTNSGAEISLFEAYDDQGNWRRELFNEETNLQWDGNVGIEGENKAFMDYKLKADYIIEKLHGNFNPKSPMQYRKYVLKRMLGQFRASWMSVGVQQRFGERHFSEHLGRDVEGRYRTMYQTLGLKKSLSTLVQLAFKRFDATQFRAQDRAIIEENMRKNLMEIYIYSLMVAVFLGLKQMAGDDELDDDERRKYRFAHNILWRVIGETTFYLSPKTFLEITRDPLPVMQLAKRVPAAIDGAISLIFDDDLTDSEIHRNIAKLTNMSPGLNNLNKITYAQTMNR
jgi:hypothetical protein